MSINLIVSHFDMLTTEWFIMWRPDKNRPLLPRWIIIHFLIIIIYILLDNFEFELPDDIEYAHSGSEPGAEPGEQVSLSVFQFIII